MRMHGVLARIAHSHDTRWTRGMDEQMVRKNTRDVLDTWHGWMDRCTPCTRRRTLNVQWDVGVLAPLVGAGIVADGLLALSSPVWGDKAAKHVQPAIRRKSLCFPQLKRQVCFLVPAVCGRDGWHEHERPRC